MSAFLELKGLTKSFDAGQARYEVFSDVSLTLEGRVSVHRRLVRLRQDHAAPGRGRV
jgi:hypothetical protein